MAKKLYCWRCQMVLPMLDEEEYSAFFKAFAESEQDRLIDDLREQMEERKQRALRIYKQITGFEETNINAVFHHRIAQYGPPCHRCGKPLRTPLAAFCAACGADRK